jgi:hypothetical protein
VTRRFELAANGTGEVAEVVFAGCERLTETVGRANVICVKQRSANTMEQQRGIRFGEVMGFVRTRVAAPSRMSYVPNPLGRSSSLPQVSPGFASSCVRQTGFPTPQQDIIYQPGKWSGWQC